MPPSFSAILTLLFVLAFPLHLFYLARRDRGDRDDRQIIPPQH